MAQDLLRTATYLDPHPHSHHPAQVSQSTNQSSGVSFVTGQSTACTESVYDEDDEGYVEVDLPEHSCAYCGICDPASVVKCVESG
jgi:ferredoxin-like protein FixX